MTWETLITRIMLASSDLVLAAAVVMACVWLLRIRSYQVRSLLWLIVLLKPMLTLVGVTPFAFTTLLEIENPVIGSPTHGVAQFAPTSPLFQYLGYLWGIGVLLYISFLLRDLIRVRNLVKNAHAADAATQQLCQNVALQLGISGAPPVLQTRQIGSPALVGLFRPVILIPRWLKSSYGSDDLQWVLRHELIHFKSRDTLIGLIRHCTQALFFFHPLAWWSGARWEEARELACDRAVILDPKEASVYATALANLLEHTHQRRLVLNGLYAVRTQIGRRIAALITDQTPARPMRVLQIIAVSLFCLLCFSFGVGRVDAGSGTPPMGSPVVRDASNAFSSTQIAEEECTTAQLCTTEVCRILVTDPADLSCRLVKVFDFGPNVREKRIFVSMNDSGVILRGR